MAIIKSHSPLSLPMGWSLSPPYFCAFTETCADVANTYLANIGVQTHPYAHVLHPPTPPSSNTHFHSMAIFPYNPTPPSRPLTYNDVYLDDFMVLAQPPEHLPALHTLLHHIYNVFQDTTDSPRRQVASQSKVDKGEAWFSTRKGILGWDIDSATMTLHLPPHRLERLDSLLTSTLGKSFTTRKQWQQLLGELCSMMLALHSSLLLFSVLQNVLKGTHCRMRLTGLTKRALHDWLVMLHEVATHPVPIAFIVPRAPKYLAATDASKDAHLTTLPVAPTLSGRNNPKPKQQCLGVGRRHLRSLHSPTSYTTPALPRRASRPRQHISTIMDHPWYHTTSLTPSPVVASLGMGMSPL
jgi:hypothetical protein